MIRNKKGIAANSIEIALSIIFLTIVFVTLLFVSYNQILKVHAVTEADKADFACKNALITIMNFNYDSNYDFEEKLISSYAAKDYSDFGAKIEETINKFMQEGTWTFIISSNSSNQVFGEKEIDIGKKEAVIICSVPLALPCTPNSGECSLDIALVNKYEK